MGVVIKALRDSARGEQCTVRAGCCNNDPETTVLAHLPNLSKGMGNKGDDWHAMFACSACHEMIDQHRFAHHDEMIMCLTGIQITQRRWYELGLMTFPKTPQPPAKPLNKTVPRPAKFRR